MKIIFNGIIKSGEDSEFMIGEEIVADVLEETEFYEMEIHLRYTLSNSPINLDTVDVDAYKSLMGVLDAEHGCIPFSEWTGFVGWDDTLTVGGHDLKNELLQYAGMYCYLELWQASG